MTKEKLIELYLKERKYQKDIFGDYKINGAINFASFIAFIEIYLEKAKVAYVKGPWLAEHERPDWLEDCKEYESEEFAPAKAYEDLVKVFALAGAALETLADIDPDEWREDVKNNGGQ